MLHCLPRRSAVYRSRRRQKIERGGERESETDSERDREREIERGANAAAANTDWAAEM